LISTPLSKFVDGHDYGNASVNLLSLRSESIVVVKARQVRSIPVGQRHTVLVRLRFVRVEVEDVCLVSTVVFYVHSSGIAVAVYSRNMTRRLDGGASETPPTVVSL
jgi:hypothetical protein